MRSDEDAEQIEKQELEFLIEQRQCFALAQKNNDALHHKLKQRIEHAPKVLAELEQIEELLDLADAMHESDIRAEKMVRADSPSLVSMPLFPGLAASTPELKALQDELLGLKQMLIKSVWTRADDRCLEAAVLNECRKLAAYKLHQERHPDPLGAVKAMNDTSLSRFSLPGYMRSSEDDPNLQDAGEPERPLRDEPVDWTEIATRLAMTAAANAHSAQACRTRWLMVIRPGLNNTPWSEEEQQKLCAAVEQMLKDAESIDWEEAAKAVGNGRLPVQCLMAYQRLTMHESNNQRFNNPPAGRENLYDEELLRMLSIWGTNWPLVSERLRRSAMTLQNRFTTSLDESIQHGQWKAEEFKRLYDAVREQVLAFESSHGPDSVPAPVEGEAGAEAATTTTSKAQDAADAPSAAKPSSAEILALQDRAAKVQARLNWPLITARVRTRSKAQCRDKWLERPAQRGPWTLEEDLRLAELVGKNPDWTWTQIGQSVSNRTGKQARDRWMLTMKSNKGAQKEW